MLFYAKFLYTRGQSLRRTVSDSRRHIGRYEIERELGRGAQGVVYAATDPVIGRQVAIKTIRLDVVEDVKARSELTRRLFREAQSAGTLSHSGIITIYDVGEIDADAYIVMEFVAGRTLEEVLASGIPQHSKTLLSILEKAADALDFAHSKGIVHRDIKPSNIMICNDGTVKVADFGIAKITTSNSLTQTGFVLGTPNYMSPEQAQGHEIEGRSDQFSLAVVAYRMMSGKLPFEGPTLTALLTKILWEEPEYESSGLREPLRHAFERAFSKDPRLRFPTCADFVKAIEAGCAQPREALHTSEPGGSEHETIMETVLQVPLSAAESSLRRAEPVLERALDAASANAAEKPEQSASIKPAARTKRNKNKFLLVYAAILGVAVLAVAAFLLVNKDRKDALPESLLPETAVSPNKTAQPGRDVSSKPAAADASRVVTSEKRPIPPTQPRHATSQERSVEATASAITPKPVKPLTGAMTWSGQLGKNSVLVIRSQTASVGSIEGDFFPGRPVSVEVQPKEVVIRQMPSGENGWQQIMLYSGKSKYESITIRWKTAAK